MTSNYKRYENPFILREMIIEQREHIAYLLKTGCRLELIMNEFTELQTLEGREKDAWKEEMENGTL